jgi:hypothetical protein
MTNEILKDRAELASARIAAFDADPETEKLRAYLGQIGSLPATLASGIHRIVTGETPVEMNSIDTSKMDLIRLSQITHVVKTIPAGNSLYREKLTRDMEKLLASATEDYKTIAGWASFAADRRAQ